MTIKILNKNGDFTDWTAGYPDFWAVVEGAGATVTERSVAITRIQQATGRISQIGSTSFTISLPSIPIPGNVFVLLVGSDYGPGNVTSIVQTGVAWSSAAVLEGQTSTGSAAIYYGVVTQSGAAQDIVVNVSLTRATIGIIAEYSGLAIAPLDKIASNANLTGTNHVTGTTAVTARVDELWIGGINTDDDSKTYSTPQNSFTIVDQGTSDPLFVTGEVSVVMLERIVLSIGTASSGVTSSSSTVTAGVIATFLGGAGACNLYAPNPSPSLARITQDIAVTIGNTYTLTFLVGYTGGFGAGLIVADDGVGAHFNETYSSVDVGTKTIEFTATTKSISLRFQLVVTGLATNVTIDDVFLEFDEIIPAQEVQIGEGAGGQLNVIDPIIKKSL